jgi:colanic acid/amylovoran biosynthesis glycosyltransferase
VYVTSRFPFGDVEAFLLPEVESVAARVAALRVVPLRPSPHVAHDDARRVVAWSESEPLISPRVLRVAGTTLARKPGGVVREISRLRHSRSASMLTKNGAVVPKAIWLARRLLAQRVDHVHAHWGGTTSTLAMLAAELAGVPWSLTLHRWDIGEDNLLAVRLVAVGDLVPVKGHDLLLETFTILRRNHPHRDVRLDIVGIGPLRRRLEQQAVDLGIADRVTFAGLLGHDRLLRLLHSGRWSAIVHPSLDRSDLHEGIPVVLMEAMSAGVPVVATRSGGVSELVRRGTGILVGDRDANVLAGAVETLLNDPDYADALGERGREHVARSFDAARIADELVARFAAATSTRAA